MSINKPFEEDLIEQAKNGNQIAFTKLFNKYKRLLHNYFYFRIHDSIIIEDLVMDALSKAFCNIHKYKKDTSFNAWIFKIAKNNYIDYIKAYNIRPILIKPNEEQNEVLKQTTNSHYLNPEQIMIQYQQNVLLRQCVAELKSEYRKAFIMYSLQGMSYKDIAQQLNVSISIISGRIRYARKHLIKRLSIN